MVACLRSLTLGYALFREFVRRATGPEDPPGEELDTATEEVLLDIGGLAYPEKTP